MMAASSCDAHVGGVGGQQGAQSPHRRQLAVARRRLVQLRRLPPVARKCVAGLQQRRQRYGRGAQPADGKHFLSYSINMVYGPNYFQTGETSLQE